MKLLMKIVFSSILVMFLSHFIKGVYIENFTTSIIVAVVLGLLNIFVKPILVLFTLPVTVFTLGLFLLVINAILILLCAKIVGGFRVDSFFTALIFSIVLSLLQSIMYGLLKEDKK
jgi:putative membrane protein